MTETPEWEQIEGGLRRFTCEPPPADLPFQVIREDVEERDGVIYRTIHEVKPL